MRRRWGGRHICRVCIDRDILSAARRYLYGLGGARDRCGEFGNLSIAVFKNGSEVAQATKIIDATNGATTRGVALLSMAISCAASDALTIRIFQSQGAAVALGSAPVANWVSVVLVPLVSGINLHKSATDHVWDRRDIRLTTENQSQPSRRGQAQSGG